MCILEISATISSSPLSIKKKLYGPFLWMVLNCLKAAEPLQGQCLLFTLQFPGVPDIQLVNLGRMKGWVTLEPASGFESQTEHLQQWEIYNFKDFCCYCERPNFCYYLLWQFWFVYVFVFARRDRKLKANWQIKMLQKENTATLACSATFLVHLINYIAQYT